jgi:hypothetical protein
MLWWWMDMQDHGFIVDSSWIHWRMSCSVYSGGRALYLVRQRTRPSAISTQCFRFALHDASIGARLHVIPIHREFIAVE